MSRKKITLPDLRAQYEQQQPITMVTAYDYPSAILADRAGVEMILVGDSLGMVVHGLESTVPVTMEMMVLHSAAVVRAKGAPFVVTDMPFGSYEVSREEALRNAIRLVREGGAEAVKLEGGVAMAETARAIVRAGIPVMGHIGLTPQSAVKLGGFRVQGKDARAALSLMDDALALQEAGCFSIVLEAIPDRVAAAITERLDIPTIGIGAGLECSGQVLVWHDMLGLFDRFLPKFAQRFGDAGALITQSLADYVSQVHNGTFPTAAHSFTISDAAWEAFERGLDGEREEPGEETALY